jgi:hypothetical protein
MMENKKVFFAHHYPSRIVVHQDLVTGANGLHLNQYLHNLSTKYEKKGEMPTTVYYLKNPLDLQKIKSRLSGEFGLQEVGHESFQE